MSDNFLDDLKDFNMQTAEAMDSAATAGDKEAMRNVVAKMFSPALPKIARRVQELALFSDSDATSLNACKTVLSFLFDEKAGDEDSFTKLMNELSMNDKKENSNTVAE